MGQYPNVVMSVDPEIKMLSLKQHIWSIHLRF